MTVLSQDNPNLNVMGKKIIIWFFLNDTLDHAWALYLLQK